MSCEFLFIFSDIPDAKEDTGVICEAFCSKKVTLEFERCLLQNSKGRHEACENTGYQIQEMQALQQDYPLLQKKEITHLLSLDLSPRWQAMKFNLIK